MITIETFKTLVKNELSLTIKNLFLWVCVVGWIIIILTEGYAATYEGGFFDERSYANSLLLINSVSFVVPLIGGALIIVFSSEMVWRDRDCNFHLISGPLLVSNSLLFWSKVIVLVLINSIMLIIGIACCIILNYLLDGLANDYLIYFKWLVTYGFQLTFFSILGLSIQNLVSSKYVGMAILGFLLISVNTPLSNLLGINTPWLSIGTPHFLGFDQLVFFNSKWMGFLIGLIYWTSLLIPIVFISIHCWGRGAGVQHTEFMRGIRNARRQILFPISGLLVFFFLGLIIYSNYQNGNGREWISDNTREAYERKFSKYYDQEVPAIVAIDIDIDVQTSSNAYSVSVASKLRNLSEKSIQSLLVTERIPLDLIEVDKSSQIHIDQELRSYIIEFTEPLKPNEVFHLSYKTSRQIGWFENSLNVSNHVAYIRQDDFEPIIGYFAGLELRNIDQREQRGLPSIGNEIRFQPRPKVILKARIGTDKNQFAITSGELVQESSGEKRTYSKYETKNPVANNLAYIIGEFERSEFRVGNNSLSIYSRKGNGRNLELIGDYYSKVLPILNDAFNEYPEEYLSVIELPDYWPFSGVSHPSVLSFRSNRFFTLDTATSLRRSLLKKRLVHELSHQWWGNRFIPTNGYGAAVMVEGLAKYSESMVLRQLDESMAVRRNGQEASGRYFNGVRQLLGTEPSLSRSIGERYMAYGKGYFAFQSFAEQLGENEFHSVLKDLVRESDNNLFLDHEISDVVNKISKSSNNSEGLANQWLEEKFVYNVSVSDLKILDSNDQYNHVTFQLHAKKNNSDDQTNYPLNEPLLIGYYNENEDLVRIDTLQMTQIDSTVEVLIDDLITSIVADPFAAKLEINFSDNILEIK